MFCRADVMSHLFGFCGTLSKVANGKLFFSFVIGNKFYTTTHEVSFLVCLSIFMVVCKQSHHTVYIYLTGIGHLRML